MTTAVQPFTGTFQADPVHSTIGFGVKYAGAGTFRGNFADVTASLTAGDDGASLEGAAQVESISVQNPPQFRAHLLGAEFFDAEAHPEITFRSQGVELSDDGSARVEGELTIAGRTQNVTATGTWSEPVAAAGGVNRASLLVETTVDRRDFGIEWQMALPNGGDALGYDVTLEVNLALVQPEA
jgi:polyisoprenoid-binding protein YceI